MSIFATHRAVKRLTGHMEDLSARVYTLETANKRLGLEWEELYDKVRHQMSRMARRAAVDAPIIDDVPEGVDVAPGVLGSDPISQKILARRARGRQEG